MPVYQYKGYNAAGKQITGTQDADSLRTLKALLRRDGVFLTELQEARNTGTVAPGKGRFWQTKLVWQERIAAQDLAVATRQLATLLHAGIPLVDALNALIDQLEHQRFKSIWSDIKQRVNEGSGLGDALANHSGVFSGLYINMVRAGETSGAMDVVLGRLAEFTESQATLRSKISGTMIYPVIMIAMAFFVVGILMVVVIPKISKIFVNQKIALPLPTLVLINLSNFMVQWYWLLFVVLGLAIWLGRRYIQSPKGKPKWDKFMLHVPIFGTLVQMVAIARFSRTLSTLLASGVPLLAAFDIVKNVVQNSVLLDVIETARDCVKEGDSIAAPLRRSGYFPPIVTHMIAVGEKSGQLEEMLANVARSYEQQVDTRLQAMTSLLEPMLLVFMGIVVAFIVVSVLMPMLEMSSLG